MAQRTHWVRFRLAMLLLLLVPLEGCSGAPRTLYGKSIDGQVLDAQTGKPIAGAYVMYLWEAGVIPTSFSAHNAPEICYHAAAATTDLQGRYHIDAWEKPQRYNVPNREPSAWGYARGYVPAEIHQPDGPEREPTVHPNDVIRLQMSRASGDERLEELSMISRRTCLHGGNSHKDLYPIKKAVYDEARTIATTPKQQAQLKWFREAAAWAWLAPGPAGDMGKLREEMNEFERKNLQ